MLWFVVKVSHGSLFQPTIEAIIIIMLIHLSLLFSLEKNVEGKRKEKNLRLTKSIFVLRVPTEAILLIFYVCVCVCVREREREGEREREREAWNHLFYPKITINSRTDCFLWFCYDNQSRLRKTQTSRTSFNKLTLLLMGEVFSKYLHESWYFN